MLAREPYFKARLRELRESGLARPRERIYRPPPPTYVYLVQRAARRFQRELPIQRVMDVYWVATEERITIRRVGTIQPREVPVGSVFMGRYRYPHPPARFVEDLTALITKGEA